MAHDLSFSIVHCTGEEPGHLCSELLLTEGSKGWCTPKSCSYPQELTIKLPSPSTIHQLKFLSHEYKIASTIEIHVAPCLLNGSAPSSFTILGQIRFDSNIRSQYGARELKSVTLDGVTAQFIRIVLLGCHQNEYNTSNQASFMGLTILGAPVGASAAEPKGARHPKSPLKTYATTSSPLSIEETLSKDFPKPPEEAIAREMRVDKVTAQKILQLQVQKKHAVDKEDYDEAKHLKQVIERLQSLGTQIAVLEAKKKEAVESEDYDQAKALKLEIERLRSGRPLGGAENAGKSDTPHSTLTRHTTGTPIYDRDDPTAVQESSHPSQEGWEDYGENPKKPVVYPHGGDQTPNGSPWIAYENRPAVARGSYSALPEDEGQPAVMSRRDAQMGEDGENDEKAARERGGTNSQVLPLENNPRKSSLNEPSTVSTPTAKEGDEESERPNDFPADLPPPSPIAPSNAKDGGPLIEIVGEYRARAALSKNWQLREAAIKAVNCQIPCFLSPDDDSVLRVMCRCFILRGLKDRVPAVVVTTLNFLKTLVEVSQETFPEKAPLPRDSVAELLPVLMERASDTHVRVKDHAIATIVWLAHVVDLSPLYSVIVRPPPKGAATPPKALVGRLHVVSQLLPCMFQAKSNASRHAHILDLSMEFLKVPLAHSNAEVRALASSLVSRIGEFVGPSAVSAALPPGLNPKLRDSILHNLGVHGAENASWGHQRSPYETKPRVEKPSVPSSRRKSPLPAGLQSPAPREGGRGGFSTPSTHDPKNVDIPAYRPHDPALFEEELRAREAALGPQHPAVAEALTNVAVMYSQNGHSERALPLYERALCIYEDVEGTDSLNVAHTLTDMAVVHLEAGRDEAGRKLLERALKIQKDIVGPQHPDVLAIQDVLDEQWGV